MPSKFTEHFGLNLWDVSDRVHHDDFNEDNRKIDVALAGMLGRPQKLLHLPGSPEGSADIKYVAGGSYFDWSNYEYVALLLDYSKCVNVSGKSIDIRVFSTDIPIVTVPEASSLILFWAGHKLSNPVRGIVLGDSLQYFSDFHSYEYVVQFCMSSAGSRMSNPDITIVGLS